MDGGGVLLVWKPVLLSDAVTYCVQYCTEGGFTKAIQQQLPAPVTPGAGRQWTIDPYVQRKPLAFQEMLIFFRERRLAVRAFLLFIMNRRENSKCQLKKKV